MTTACICKFINYKYLQNKKDNIIIQVDRLVSSIASVMPWKRVDRSQELSLLEALEKFIAWNVAI